MKIPEKQKKLHNQAQTQDATPGNTLSECKWLLEPTLSPPKWDGALSATKMNGVSCGRPNRFLLGGKTAKKIGGHLHIHTVQ